MPLFPSETTEAEEKDLVRYREQVANDEELWREHFSFYLSLLPETQQRRKPSKTNRQTWKAAIRSVDGDHGLIRDAIGGHIWDDWKGRLQYNHLHHILKRSNIDRFAEWHKDTKLRPRKEPIYPHLKGKYQNNFMVGKTRRKGPPGTPGFLVQETCTGINEKGELMWAQIQ